MVTGCALLQEYCPLWCDHHGADLVLLQGGQWCSAHLTAWDSRDPPLLAAVSYIMSKAWEDQAKTISDFPTGQVEATPRSVLLSCTCPTSRWLPSFLPAFGCINILIAPRAAAGKGTPVQAMLQSALARHPASSLLAAPQATSPGAGPKPRDSYSSSENHAGTSSEDGMDSDYQEGGWTNTPSEARTSTWCAQQLDAQLLLSGDAHLSEGCPASLTC